MRVKHPLVMLYGGFVVAVLIVAVHDFLDARRRALTALTELVVQQRVHAQAHAEEHHRFYMEHTEKIGEQQDVFVLHDTQDHKCTLVILQHNPTNGTASLTSQPVACEK